MRREERYVVIKKSDLKKALAPEQQKYLIGLLDCINNYRFDNSKSKLKTVVVESDWPEYERVWKMIEAHVNMENQHDAVRHSENHISLSEGVLVFAQLMVEDVIQDTYEEGYDLTAGLFGPHLSQLMVQVNEWRKKAELLDKLRETMGYIQNGTDQVVHIFQDDATLSYMVTVGTGVNRQGVSSPSFEGSILKAHQEFGGQ